MILVAVDTPLEKTSATSQRRGRGPGIGGLGAVEATRRERPLVVVNRVGFGRIWDTLMLVRRGSRRLRGDANFLVASNPEFHEEGSAIYDSLFRIGCGRSESERPWKSKSPLQPLIERAFYEMDPRTKVAGLLSHRPSAPRGSVRSNAFLATKVRCINEIANSATGGCGRTGSPTARLRRRIGPLSVAIGWGVVLAKGRL